MMETKNKNIFSNNQFGFTSGKITVDAPERIKYLAETVKLKGNFWLLFIDLFDVKHEFNSIQWKHLRQGFENREVPNEINKSRVHTVII